MRALPADKGGQAPSIAITAHARSSERAVDAGFRAHLAEPVDPTELARVVAGLTLFTVRHEAD